MKRRFLVSGTLAMALAPLLACPLFAGGLADLELAENNYLLQGTDREQINAALAGQPEFKLTSSLYSDGSTVRPVKYDPVLWTIAAGLRSRTYDRGRGWQPVPLEWKNEKKAYYRKPVPSHYLKTQNAQTLLILLSSTYSTWKRGSWVNQLISAVQESASVDFLGIGGFLTSEILASEPRFPPLAGAEIAEDLYVRIFDQLEAWKEEGVNYKKVVLVGASGGASLVIQLLAEDAKQGTELFNGGAIAFSPILDFRHSFELLDKTVDAVIAEDGFPEKMGLTNTAPESIGMLLEGILSRRSLDPTPTAEEILALTAFDSDIRARAQSKMLQRLFFNEFIATDLHDTTKASHSTDFHWDWTADDKKSKDLPVNQGDRHTHYFMRYAFDRHKKEGRVAPGESFEEYTDVLKAIESVEAPLYLVFPQDDPVLSQNALSQTSAPQATLERVRQVSKRKGQFHFFTPKFGGHMGFFLDKRFVQAVMDAFVQ